MPLYALGAIEPQLAAPETTFIAPDASVIGDIRIGRDVGIWFGAVLRGDCEPITIGDGSNVQEHVVLHTDPGFPVVIGQGCTVGHRAMLHGCTIGDNTLIGIGAIVLNGARIGNNCLVGAGALVTEGKEFPDGSLIVGAPARAVRSLDPPAVERLRLSSAHYVANAGRYRRELKTIG